MWLTSNSKANVTKKPLTREHQDKHLWVEWNDGEISDITLRVVSECEEHEDRRGIVYDLISTNGRKRSRTGPCWGHMKDIKSFEIIGDCTLCNLSLHIRA
jgi:hypothetical protein